MSNDSNSAIAFIEKLVNRLFDQLIRGDYNFTRDFKALERYTEQARKLNAPLLEARALNVMAILHNVSGRSDEAETYFLNVVKLYRQQENHSGLAATYGNLATVNTTRGEYEIALDYYHQGLALKDENNYQFLLSSKMSVLLTLERYDDIDACYAELKIIMDKPISTAEKANYARFMSGVYRTMAEVHLHRQQIDEAKSTINMARDFAQGLNLTFGLAEIYFTDAHIALLHDKDETQADTYWETARDTLKGIHSPSHIGRSYLEEARYLKRKGCGEKSEEFARRALGIFERYEMATDIAMTQELLALR